MYPSIAAALLTLPPSAKIYLSLSPCDMRKGFDGLAPQVRNILQLDPFSGAVFLVLGKRGDRLKALVWDGSGLCLYAKRQERGKFVWPRANEGAVRLSAAQLLRVQFGRSSEKMAIAQLRLMFDEVEAPEPANDDAPEAVSRRDPARKPGSRAPIPAHFPRQAVEHQPGPRRESRSGPATRIGEDVTEVLDYIQHAAG